MNSSLNRWLNVFGGSLGLLGVLFVFVRLNTYSEQIELGRFDLSDWCLIGFLALVYGIANGPLALAWWRLLAFLKVSVYRRWAVKVYGL